MDGVPSPLRTESRAPPSVTEMEGGALGENISMPVGGRMLAHMGRSLQGMKRSRRTMGHFVLLVLSPLIMAFIAGWYGLGAFKPWPSRLAAIPFWVGLMLLLWGVTYLLLWAVRRRLPIHGVGLPLLGLGVASAIAGTFVFRPLASLYGHTYGWIMGYARDRVITPFPHSLETLLSWHLDYIPFIFMWTLGLLLFELLVRHDDQSPDSARRGQEGRDAFRDLLERVGPENLVAVCAEGHYVRVHTVGGEVRLLYRFSSALGALADRQGVQVHRSHWVNTRHVTHFHADAARAHVTVTGGIRLPVSLTYRDGAAFAFGAAGHGGAPRAVRARSTVGG